MLTPKSAVSAAFLGLGLLAFCLPEISYAATGNISGTWKGGGRATGTDGKTYRVRCKMSIQARPAVRFYVSGKCTSQKGTATGHGTVIKKGGRYTGTAASVAQFGNGTLSLVPRGKRISLRIRGKKGGLTVSLRKSR